MLAVTLSCVHFFFFSCTLGVASTPGIGTGGGCVGPRRILARTNSDLRAPGTQFLVVCRDGHGRPRPNRESSRSDKFLSAYRCGFYQQIVGMYFVTQLRGDSRRSRAGAA